MPKRVPALRQKAQEQAKAHKPVTAGNNSPELQAYEKAETTKPEPAQRKLFRRG